MTTDFYSALRHRRSIYSISDEPVLSDERIQEIISEAVKHTPSAFNSQSTRIVLLLREQHHKLWDLTKETLRQIVKDASAFESTAQKMAGFRAGYGTVLFFEDKSVIEHLQSQFASYKDNFPIWSQHTNGMHQFVVWTALEMEGLGASLQHYNPLIDDQVKKEWSLPDSWQLIAQLPFGKPTAPAGEKQFQPLDDRFKIFK